MEKPGPGEAPELQDFGSHLLIARTERGLSQSELAKRCALVQTQISYFEVGQRRPTLDQFLRIARALDVSVQRLLSGSDYPQSELKDLAVELRRLGIADLWVKETRVPGAFRRPEEVIALAVSGRNPDPRIIEAIPAVLAWNKISPTLLRAHGVTTRTVLRLAWLADVALSIERQGGFPGGCLKDQLERFNNLVPLPTKVIGEDDLGKPSTSHTVSPLWRRWKIGYGATLDEFKERAKRLDQLRGKKTTLLMVLRNRLRDKKARAEKIKLKISVQSPTEEPQVTPPGVQGAKRPIVPKGRPDGK